MDNLYSIFYASVLDKKQRRRVAKQILTVIQKHLSKKTNKFKVLDIGCSSGTVTEYLSRYFEYAVGIDIDKNSLDKANKSFKNGRLSFLFMNAEKLDFPPNQFDIVVCNQVYNCVESPKILFREIFRVLKKGGICFLGAGNKIRIWENQYNLPLLSLMPKKAQMFLIKISGKSVYTSCSYLSYWQLEKLCRAFKIYKITSEIIKSPSEYNFVKLKRYEFATKYLPVSLLQKLEPVLPTFIWILEKPL